MPELVAVVIAFGAGVLVASGIWMAGIKRAAERGVDRAFSEAVIRILKEKEKE